MPALETNPDSGAKLAASSSARPSAPVSVTSPAGQQSQTVPVLRGRGERLGIAIKGNHQVPAPQQGVDGYKSDPARGTRDDDRPTHACSVGHIFVTRRCGGGTHDCRSTTSGGVSITVSDGDPVSNAFTA